MGVVTLVLPPQPRGDVEGVPFRQARNFTRAERKLGDVLWVVIHTAECAEVKSAAENLAAWAAGPQAPRASWHFAVDADSVTQSVLEKDVAWGAPGANKAGIHVEHGGRANQDEIGWADWYSRAMLLRSAEQVAGICRRWQLPPARVGVDALRQNEPGICGHHDVSLAFKKSTHVDPGKNFPWETFLEEVHRIYRELSTMPPKSGTIPPVPDTPRNC
jgi:N-acetyl-anhydromuramyl-L-alanine amidase AmpD